MISTKLLKFNEELESAHNGSIIEEGNGYLIVIRNETSNLLCNLCKIRVSEMKLAHLDKNFEQVGKIKTITIKPSIGPEDPRLFRWHGELYLTYNDEPYEHIHTKRPIQFPSRRLFVGKLNITEASISDAKPIAETDFLLTDIEKNWVPFEYPEQHGDLYYIYMTSPYRILKIDASQEQLLGTSCKIKSQLVYRNQQPSSYLWENDVWGDIRGGTPARLVDGVYITFFHAWKKCPDTKNFFYMMGAYTFEAQPPFRILQITPNPILFKDVYTANYRDDHIRTTYPAGFAIEKKGEDTILHISCGENDKATRIVSLNYKDLLQTMVPVI